MIQEVISIMMSMQDHQASLVNEQQIPFLRTQLWKLAPSKYIRRILYEHCFNL